MVKVILTDGYDDGPEFEFESREQAEEFIKMQSFRIEDDEE